MHIGNVYAALAAWLSARAGRGAADRAGSSDSGRLLLRIEDIDAPRVKPDADRWIMDDLHWLGLDWDGDPVYQSDRGDLYERALDVLRDRDVLYPCFCSRAEIRAASAPQEGDGYVIYPGTCARLGSAEREARLRDGRRHSWRARLPESSVGFDDLIFGPQRFDLARQIGDTVLRRSDGLFSYQLAVVVDDLTMGVNDVVRGRDLLRSTALQLWIREQLVAGGFSDMAGGMNGDAAVDGVHNSGDIHLTHDTMKTAAAMPADDLRFTHLPLIDDPRGKRLAKRDRALDLGVLREEGLRPETIVGYCAWLLRLIPEPRPIRPQELLASFSWQGLERDHADRLCDLAQLTAGRAAASAVDM
ncbi:tRNA glutamyl-Q(34) synthetase GluQRS [Bifidobacterium sp. SMB2]|uniref:tRNA glutamyl-Q(34) synthetase GluQRS n=2 Tax=Bifidobacterium TaxID=1678 RepID=A0ABX0CHQ0_9BIFI|nr:tRNA glutamyl-Q(34) synthetase GluQRS [Bifidobacterium sp. SMB2]NEH12369.1 tRNA glutamyl-Q(34) synthetase GluQRS [Bifidobacterium saimiriisciurei]